MLTTTLGETKNSNMLHGFCFSNLIVTISMDWETESTMQSVIETEFAHQTVIAVIHRFRYIDRFDRVVLFKQGCLTENGDPTSLLTADSEFRKLYQAWKNE